MPTVNIFWFRRDLRLEDNAGLYHALKSSHPVVPVFIFDTNILDQLEDKEDRRVEFIHAGLEEIQDKLVKLGSSLEVYHGTPIEVYKELVKKYTIETVFTNHDYEPYALEREKLIGHLLKAYGAVLKTFKDQVLLEKNEVLKDDGKPYTVFTPYSRKWKAVLTDFHLKPYPAKKYFKNFFKQPPKKIPSLQSIGFTAVDKPFPSKQLNDELVKKYGEQRNFPS
ncbi:MAG: deoxyribodipyrimidine photo-lyase, partial [Bacteroidota bacterium]